MRSVDIYKELNSITQKTQFTKVLLDLFVNYKVELINNKKQLTFLEPENVMFLPLGKNGNFAGYLVFKDVDSSDKAWEIAKKYHAELSAVALRIKEHHNNHLAIKHINVLSNIQIIANSEEKLTYVYEKIVEQLRAILDFDRASVALIDNSNETMVMYAVFDRDKTNLDVGRKLALMETAPGWVMVNGIPNIENDFLQDKKFKEDYILEKEGYRSALRVPLRFKENLLGTLNFNSKKPANFTSFDADFLTKVADILAYAITNANIINDIRNNTIKTIKENRELSLLNKISHLFCEKSDFRHLMKEIIKEITTEFSLLGGEFHLFVGRKVSIERFYCNKERKQEVISEEILLKMKAREIYYNEKEEIIYLPIHIKDTFAGVLQLSGELRELYLNSFSLLEALIKQLSIVMNNALLYRSVKYAAEYDSLTGLQNKKKFFSTLKREISRIERNNGKLVLLMIDIDNFKLFNDRYGHLSGDSVIKKVVKVIRRNLRKSDIAGRFGGEEFLILLPNTIQASGFEFAKRLSLKIYEQTGSFKITVSIGVSEYMAEDDEISLVERADNALYHAKKTGKNQVVIASRR